MEHGVRVYGGVTKASWDALLKKLEASRDTTQKKIAEVHAARDFHIDLNKGSPIDPNYRKNYQGNFDKPIDGIRVFEKLSEDLAVCHPHIDITRAKEIATSRKLTQRHSSYPERAASAVLPSKFDSPFFLRWVPAKGGSLVVLTPNGFSDGVQEALETEILSRLGADPKLTTKTVPDDPLVILETLDKMKRLGKIDSANLTKLDKDGNAVGSAGMVFRADGSLPAFKKWLKEESGRADRVVLRSINVSVPLDDLGGKNFDLDLRPGDEDKPIGVRVSQKSDLRADAYQVVTDALQRVLF
jgi:hypothetical protein